MRKDLLAAVSALVLITPPALAQNAGTPNSPAQAPTAPPPQVQSQAPAPVTGRQPGDEPTTDALPTRSGASGDAPSSDLTPGQKPGEPRPATRPSPQDSTVDAPPNPR
jgi:hypothetical protein